MNFYIRLFGLSAVLPVLAACNEYRFKPLYTSPKLQQQEAASALAPAKMDSGPTWGAAPVNQTVRIRVYADSDFRSLTPRWEEVISRQLDRAASFAQPRYGVTFVVQAVRAWKHSGTPSLDAAIQELQELDRGEDVDLVLGYVTALPVVTSSQHQLGMAIPFGKHAVLRSMENPQEALAFSQGLHLLSSEEQAKLVRERKAHKEVSVFLHEWAHTLGAVHVEGTRNIMFPTYGDQQDTFGPSDSTVRLGLRFRKESPANGDLWDEWRKALMALATSPEAAEWNRVERDQLVQSLGGASSDVLETGDRNEPRSAQAYFLLARKQLERKDLDAAETTVRLASARLVKEAAAPPEAWLQLASLHSQLLSVTWAEEAAARTPSLAQSSQIRTWATQVRRSLGLPKNLAEHGVSAEQEGAYARTVQLGFQEVETGRTNEAKAHAAELHKKYPQAPGGPFLECAVAIRTGRATEAKAPCESAVKLAPEAVNAHLFLASAHATLGKWPAATRSAERALELEPTRQSIWAMLDVFYQATGKKKQRVDLRQKYRDRFGSDLH